MGSNGFQPPAVTKSAFTPYFTPANNGGAALHPDDPNTPTLFRPLQIRNVTLKNRIIVAPMCMYSSDPDPSSPFVGAMNDFHLAHLGHLALKGAGLVIIEATAVQPHGRISPNDAGLWQEGTDSAQFRGLKRVVDFMHSQGAKVGIQLGHGGRKTSVVTTWLATAAGKISIRADESVGGWPNDVVAPSGGEEHIWTPAPDAYWVPRTISIPEIQEVVAAFAHSARLAVQAGVDVIEIHAAHGYLLHEFMSPVTNKRTDEYGGSFENRTRFVREVVAAIRAAIPADMPLFLRISATEWLEGHPAAAESGSWGIESSIELVKKLPEWGVDLIDVSSGGNNKDQKLNVHRSYQTDLAGQIWQAVKATGASTLVGAVGLITEAEQARGLVQGADEARIAETMLSGPSPQADVILMARQFMREPEWVFTAAKQLGVAVTVPYQFQRAIR